MSTVVQILDSITGVAARADRTDGQLIDLFVRLRDEEAFATVVRRHGPMVLGVRRRVLHNSADADDAFQAAFLVLARKAGTVRWELLAQWLYGVAYNTARKLRQSNARRAVRERPLAESPEPLSDAPAARDDVLAVLDDELARLPDRYRTVIVLCDLEGRTRSEVAKLLNCPEGTVGGRLARARDLLAARLTARGAVPAAGVLVAVLAESAARAVSPTAVAAAVRSVGVDDLTGAAASGLISPNVAHTTERVLNSMFATKLRTLAATVLCCGLALACAGGAVHLANAQPAPDEPAPRVGGGGVIEPPPKAPPAKPAAPAENKVLTVFALKKLDPEVTAKVIADACKGKGVTVTVLAKDNAVLVHATPAATREIAALLLKLGEAPPKRAAAIRLIPGTDAAEAAKTVLKVVPRTEATVVPVPDESVLLVYATDAQISEIRDILKPFALADAKEPAAPKKFTFRMKNKPWAEVLEAYSELSGLTMITTVKPTGTFTFEPPAGKAFTLAEITDILNEGMEQQKLILIRRTMTYFIQAADEKPDLKFFPRVELKDLDQRGRSELVQVILPLQNVDVVEAADAVKRLLTPFGSIIPYKNYLIVQDTAGNIIRIRDILDATDKPPQPKAAPVGPRKPDPRPRTYSVRFEKVSWKELLTWYAAETGLTRVGDALPKGTFTFAPAKPDQPLTLAEMTDVINEALLAQKWLLVRGEKSFTVISADEKVDPKWVSRVEPEELAGRGKYELVEVKMDLNHIVTPTLMPALKKQLGPFGLVGASYKDNTLLIRDTAGRLRTLVKDVRDLDALDEPREK